MARAPSVPILAGTGSGNIPPQAQIKPDYKIILDISGGMNTNRPPDQLDDRESPDMLNLVYVNKVLSVDFGVRPLGSKVFGIPQQPIEFKQVTTGSKFELLVTSRTLYQYSAALTDWVPVPTQTGGNATVNGGIVGTGANPSVAFTGAATWTNGQLVGIIMDNGLYLVGTTGGTTSPVTVGSPLPVGRTIANGATIFPLPTFTSDASIGVSWTVDPSHGWLMFVNGFDLPQYFDGNVCKPIPNVSGVVSTARQIIRYHGVTILANTTESGIVYAYRIRRSATNDPTNWTTLDSGFDDLVDTGDQITDLILVNPYLAVVRENSIVRASYYGIGVQVLWYDYGLSSTGSLSIHSSTPTKTAAVVVTEPGIYQYNGDYGLVDIGDKIFNTLLSYSGELHTDLPLNIFLLYVPILDETWLVYADQTMQWPAKVFRYNHKTNAWFKRQFGGGLSFAGIGLFSLWGTATRWIDLGTTRWIDRHRPWNARANQPLFHQILLCGATDNQVYLYDWNTTTQDNGTPISWYYVSKDYPIPDEWKTLDGLVFYGKGIVNLVEISTDGGVSYHQLNLEGPVNMGTSWTRANVDCSLTCDFVRVRFSGTDPSFKLSWFAFKSMHASER